MIHIFVDPAKIQPLISISFLVFSRCLRSWRLLLLHHEASRIQRYFHRSPCHMRSCYPTGAALSPEAWCVVWRLLYGAKSVRGIPRDLRGATQPRRSIPGRGQRCETGPRGGGGRSKPCSSLASLAGRKYLPCRDHEQQQNGPSCLLLADLIYPHSEWRQQIQPPQLRHFPQMTHLL